MSEKLDEAEGLDRIEKYLKRILNASMVVSNAVKGIKAENEQVLQKVEGYIVNVMQAGERREGRTQATFDAFQKGFRADLGSLREEIQGVMREEVFLEQAREWIALLDDIDALVQGLSVGEFAPVGRSVSVLSARVLEVLESQGFESQVVVPGETGFDPEVHEALPPMTEGDLARAAELAPGQVVRIVRRGLGFKGRLYRPAQVVVVPARAE